MALLLAQVPAFGAANLDLDANNLVQLVSSTSQYARVTGIVNNIDVSDKFNVILLNFGKSYNTSLSAVIHNDAIPAFVTAGISEPAEYFKDKAVVLEGIIRILNGKPEIVIDSPSQIKIVDLKKSKK